MSLISSEQIFQLATVLIGLAAYGFWVETTQIGRKLSGVLIILFLGVVLSNLNLIPHSAAMYGTVSSLLVPLAIPMLLFMAMLMLMPALRIARNAMPSRYLRDEPEIVEPSASNEENDDGVPFSIIGLTAALATSMAICALGQTLAKMLGQENYFILIITILALGVANYVKPLVRQFSAEFEVGTFFMYVFFVTIGASADLATIAGVALPYVLLICGAIGIFFVLILIVGKVLKLDLAELMIAANACILGPATVDACSSSIQRTRTLRSAA